MEEDFIAGLSRVTHTYPAPNDGGNDWVAYLVTDNIPPDDTILMTRPKEGREWPRRPRDG